MVQPSVCMWLKKGGGKQRCSWPSQDTLLHSPTLVQPLSHWWLEQETYPSSPTPVQPSAHCMSDQNTCLGSPTLVRPSVRGILTFSVLIHMLWSMHNV